VQGGSLRIVRVSGTSGIGKTTLIDRFLGLLRLRNERVVTLLGRCYEFESVPYQGLDALVDDLSRYLERLSDPEVEALLTRDAFLLTKLFPVLGRIRAIAQSPVRPSQFGDAQEARLHGFRAFRELLARVSDRLPLVVWIDDLQ
jgi:eukaryotic-like serine/threonine-protein kinase